ncbi:MAG: sigma-54 dependent transcriptional regulator [Gammaproteobacteria bacterium]
MTVQRTCLCLVEDDPIMGESLCDRFELEGFAVDWHQDAGSAYEAIGHKHYALVISDIRLPDMSGEELFERVLERARRPPFLFITGYGSIDKAVKLLKLGAADYVTKPFDLEQLIVKVRELSVQSSAFSASPAHPSTLGLSAVMRRIEEMLPRLAERASAILLTGESGVGKEHVARQLHRCRRNSDARPFVAVNCGALTETLLEAELFGHEKGAFTGAVRAKKGVFELAHGGTLLLDEIGEMPLGMQVRLLRAIQERRIMRVGGERAIDVDLRLICATNRDLKSMVEQGQFREDLYYRINVIHLRIPPLRERKEDILWFAQRFLQQFNEQHPGERKTLDPDAERALLEYPWPGNIRELQHCIERACILTPHALLRPEHLFEDFASQPHGARPDVSLDGDDLNQYLRACERAYIQRALTKHAWHLGQTATYLGISRKNLWEKMKKYDIHDRSEDDNGL